MKGKNHIVHLAGIVAMVFWGFSFVWSTQVYQSLNPTATIFLRLVVATIFFTAILFVFRLNEKVKREHLGLFALAAMFEPFLYFIFEGYGLKNTSPIIGSAIVALIPLVTPIAARIFLKERLTAMNIVGLIVSFIGVIVMLLNKNLEFTASPKGILFLSGCVLVAVGYSIALIRLTRLYKPMTITWMQNIIGMLYFIPMVVIMEHFEPSNFGNVKDYIVPLVCLGVFCSATAYALWAFAYSKLGASKANVYTNLIPVFTAIFSYFIIHESLTASKIIGIVLVVLGLVFSQMKGKTK
ncbi:MAG: DMT family transporter [Bacteroidales bacterium]|nr:DMT family transporter [Bacteroidales bacterium]MBQ8959585.1 DMT family transporter [Bacteroidales bacterium]